MLDENSKSKTKRKSRKRTSKPKVLIKKNINLRAYPEDINLIENDFGTKQNFWDLAVNQHKEKLKKEYEIW